jgi:flagellar biosynthesis/type III secretory pathway M-ring protein FliF/YscJ
MELLQRILSRLQQQLGALTPSQKVALGLGALLIALSLAWMLQWAAQPDTMPLWRGALSAEELANLQSGLDALGVRHQVKNGTVYVPGSANQSALLAQLQQAGKLPNDLSSGFDAIIKDSNPFLSQAENDRRWTLALQNTLANVLRNFDGVQSAAVILNLNAERRGFARTAPPSSASVQLTMKGGEPMSERLAKAAAKLVAGAVRGLSVENVQITDSNGNTIDLGERSETSTALQRERIAQEKLIREKIRNQLAFDPLALVNVRVELTFSASTTESHTLEDPVDIAEEVTSEQRIRARNAGQAGVQPNVGLAVNAGGADESYTRETTRTEKQAGYTKTLRTTPSGDTFAVYAAINISSTYLEQVFRRFNPNVATPTQEQIEQTFEVERKRIIDQVSKLVKADDPRNVAENIAVSWYYGPSPEAAGTVATAGMDQMMELAQRFGPHAGLGLLALIALFLLMRLTKRADGAEAFGLELGLPKEAVLAAQKAASDVARVVGKPGGVNRAVAAATTSPDENALPTTSATEGVLIAQEVDEATVQIQKMIQEVDEMVKSDADAVATLFEQWIDRNDKFGP